MFHKILFKRKEGQCRSYLRLLQLSFLFIFLHLIQTHIWFESCSQCEGMYFDAGEFSDLKRDTFLDRIRDFLKGQRPDAAF